MNRTGQQRCCWLPSALRASAAAYAGRLASMVRVAVSCVAILFPLFAMADYTNTGVQIECLTSKNEVRFSAQTLTSEPALWAAAPEGERARFLRDARARNFYLEG